MKVLHVFKTYITDSIGGIEQTIYQLCKGGDKFSIQSQVFSLSKTPGEIVLDNHKVSRAKLDFQIASTGFSLSAITLFRKLAQEVDVIHYHFPWPFMDMLHFIAKIKKPTVVTYHSDVIRQKNLILFYEPLQFKFLSSINKIVTTSPNYLESSSVLQRYKDKTIVIPIGLDKADYPIPRQEILKKWEARFNGKFFLFIGAIRYYKGLHTLIEAARNVNYPIVLIGGGPNEQVLKESVDQCQIKNIHFMGELSDENKVALLMCCHAFVFPSHLRSEAFGISLLEASMYGKPLISTEIGTGTSYINIHNETGLVIQPENPNALCDAMTTLWQDQNRAEKMGRNSQLRYINYFTAERMCAAYSKIYHEIAT